MRSALFFGIAAAVQMELQEEETPIGALQSEMALVEDQIKSEGKVTPGVYETIQKLLVMVSKVIEPAIAEGRTADQLLVFTVFREIITCDAVYKKFLTGEKKAREAALATVRTEWDSCVGSVEHLKMRFKKCLDERDALVQHNNTICCQEHALCTRNTAQYGDCENVKLARGFVGCDYRSRSGSECFGHAVKLISELQGYFKAQDMKFEGLKHMCAKFEAGVKAKIAECSYLQQAVNAKVGETNKVAMDIATGNKQALKNCKDQCKSYHMCRAKTTAVFKKTVGPCNGEYPCPNCTAVMRSGKLVKSDHMVGGKCVVNREVDRYNECEATKAIKCMLNHYKEGGRFDAKLLALCQKQITGQCALNMKYPKAPPMIKCEVSSCKDCPGCGECVDRPYYQYETPCYAKPPPVPTICMEKPECPGWCKTKDGSAPPKKVIVKPHKK